MTPLKFCGYTQFKAASVNYLYAPVTAFVFGYSGARIKTFEYEYT